MDCAKVPALCLEVALGHINNNIASDMVLTPMDQAVLDDPEMYPITSSAPDAGAGTTPITRAWTRASG